MPKHKGHSSLGLDDANMGSEYTFEEVQFLREMDRYCTRVGRRFPSSIETLRVAKSMGYKLESAIVESATNV